MARKDLHDRLEAVSGKIAEAKRELEQHSRWNDGHRLDAGELEARYRYLRSELDEEIEDLEAHGERVSNLEVSVRKWLDRLFLKAG